MKSENYEELLAEYLEGDAAAEEELFARYDRELQVSSELWSNIETRIVPVAASSSGWWLKIAAVLVLTIGLGFLILGRTKVDTIASLKLPEQQPVIIQERAVALKPGQSIKRIKKPIVADNPGVLSTDLGFDLEEKDTAKHIEQTENLLRSIRNFPLSDTDEEIDVTYDKALSRRLLIENVVLRRDAEMKAKFPTKALLSDLEPLTADTAAKPRVPEPVDRSLGGIVEVTR